MIDVLMYTNSVMLHCVVVTGPSMCDSSSISDGS